MRPNQARLGAGIAALAGLWIAVYWWWDPAPEPAIRFDTAPETAPAPPPPPERSPQLTQRPGGSPEGAPGVATPVQDVPAGVLPPDFYEYVVQEDDRSLRDVARKLLGDAEAWVVIAQSNPMQDPARLQAGQVWRVPLDEANLQGVLVSADGRTITPTPARAAAPQPEEFIEYVVQPGDSLSVISQRLYGTQRHAELLYQLNRQRLQLRSPDAISVGQTLQAPKTAPR